MSHLPEVAQSSGLEVNHAASEPATNAYYTQYAEPPHPIPSKNEYIPVGEQGHTTSSSPSLICGVRRSTFWLALILAIVVIAAAVGGGVGGSIAVSNARSKSENTNSNNNNNNDDKPTPTTARETVTITPSACTTSASDTDLYTPSPPINVRRIDNSCPQSLKSQFGSDTIEYNCQDHKDYPNHDIMWFTAYTWQACIDACTSFNRRNATEAKCMGVSLGEDLQHQAVVNNGANCWLKTEVDESSTSDAEFVSVAWLVNDP